MYFLQNATNQISQALGPLQDIAKALHDTDRTNTYLVIFTAILALATIGFGIWNARTTNRQIRTSENRSDNEHFERVRPWITIEGPKPVSVILENRESVSWADYRNRDPSDRRLPSMKFTVRYSNTGIRPARNLAGIYHHSDSPITRDELEKLKMEEKHMDLGPNQESFVTMEAKWDRYENLVNLPLFIGIRISYDNGKTRSYSGVIYKVTKDQTEIISTWYV